MSPRLTIEDLEIERNGEPLEIEVDGEVFTLADPKSVGINAVLTIQSLAPADQVGLICKPGDFARLVELSKTNPELDLYFFEALMKRYLQYYKMLPSGEA